MKGFYRPEDVADVDPTKIAATMNLLVDKANQGAEHRLAQKAYLTLLIVFVLGGLVGAVSYHFIASPIVAAIDRVAVRTSN